MQVQTLGQQIFGKKDVYFEDAYRKATSLPWGYLLINLHPKTTRDEYKLLTHNTRTINNCLFTKA